MRPPPVGYVLCQLLTWSSDKLLDIALNGLPLWSVTSATHSEHIVSLHVPVLAILAYMSILFLLEMACRVKASLRVNNMLEPANSGKKPCWEPEVLSMWCGSETANTTMISHLRLYFWHWWFGRCFFLSQKTSEKKL